MVVVVLLIILAIAFGGVGLLVKGLLWLFLIALVLLVAGIALALKALRN